MKIVKEKQMKKIKVLNRERKYMERKTVHNL